MEGLYHSYTKKNDDMVVMKEQLHQAEQKAKEQTLWMVNQPEPFCEATHKQVVEYAKCTLFRQFKFIGSREELANFTVIDSPGDMTLKAFRIPEACKTSWWGTYLPAVEWAIA